MTGIEDGDDRRDDRADLAKDPDFLSLAGTVKVPDSKRDVAWDEVLRRTRGARAAERR